MRSLWWKETIEWCSNRPTLISYLDHVLTCPLTLPGSHHVDKHIRIGSGPLCLCLCAERR